MGSKQCEAQRSVGVGHWAPASESLGILYKVESPSPLQQGGPRKHRARLGPVRCVPLLSRVHLAFSRGGNAALQGQGEEESTVEHGPSAGQEWLRDPSSRLTSPFSGPLHSKQQHI